MLANPLSSLVNQRNLVSPIDISSIKQRLRRFTRKKENWSIGIYEGKSLFDLNPSYNVKNPVLSAQDVTDLAADFIADPFMIQHDKTWYMFFEVLGKRDQRGVISVATSRDGLKWQYGQVVLDEPFHLSYPHVFQWKGEYYMIPECCETRSVRLYKATEFPIKWTLVDTLLQGFEYVDPSPFRFNDYWWMFTSSPQNNILRLHYASDLLGPWIEHPKSPIISNNSQVARPGGRVIEIDGKLIRYAQDCNIRYGKQVNAFEITCLTTADYAETEVTQSPIIQARGIGWNATGMHTIDPHKIGDKKWIACVDGYHISREFSVPESA